MAPITRNKRTPQTSAPEPAASAVAAPKVHRKFDDDDTPEVIEPATVTEEVAEDSESGSDSDDDAPEAVSTSAGRDAAAAREEAAAKAIEAQEAAKRSKRKARDVKLQEQKSAAKETKKRRKVEVIEEPVEEAESESEDDEDTEMGGVKLLPASLLEKLSDERRTPPKEEVKATHTRMQDGGLELKRLKRKERDVVVDKGVVSVKVLKNEAREKKLLPPKAVGSVVGRRNNMMRGRVERRSVGKAFVVKSAF